MPDTFAPQVEVMLDIETLGRQPGCVVLSIGAIIGGSGFYADIDIGSSLDAGLAIEASTLEWWLRQPGPCRGRPHSALLPLREALQSFAKVFPKDALLWSKGPAFDVAILEAAYRAVRLDVPWDFRNVRDVRTALAMLPMPEGIPANDRLHDALSDAQHQWRQLQAARVLAAETRRD